jgi:hypothetical protein
VTTRYEGLTTGRTLFDATQVSRYRVWIQTGQAKLTGLMMVKYAGHEWQGSLINEFGINAFDFTVSHGKCKLKHTVSWLDKWYIRKVVEGDFAFLFYGAAGKGKTLLCPTTDTFVLRNERHNIEYSFQAMKQ